MGVFVVTGAFVGDVVGLELGLVVGENVDESEVAVTLVVPAKVVHALNTSVPDAPPSFREEMSSVPLHPPDAPGFTKTVSLLI